MSMDLLKKLYGVYSPSGSERKMKKFIRHQLSTMMGLKVENDNAGNLYITKGVAETYPCVVAHLDQVQDLHSKDFVAVEAGDIIVGYSLANKRYEGLGADDKNGIWVALKCLQRYEAIKVAFFVREEVGCVGSSQANMAFFDDCRFVLQCDRRNGGDLITNVWGEMCSEEFLADTDYEVFGYHVTHGMMTDVATLKSNGLAVSAVNISCGYYEPHTDTEFTIVSELYNCLNFVCHIIDKCTDVYPHEGMPKAKNQDDWRD